MSTAQMIAALTVLIAFQAQAANVAEPEMVRIPGKNYEIGKYELSQASWRAVMGDNPSKFAQCGDTCPVEQVSWNDIQKFIRGLNVVTGKQYRLPTDAEWVYACQGGSPSAYCGGDELDALGWYDANSLYRTHPVGQKQANGYGLYDMSGNVWEWVSDCSAGGCASNGVRGGSWYDEAKLARATLRGNNNAADRFGNFGFRLSRTIP